MFKWNKKEIIKDYLKLLKDHITKKSDNKTTLNNYQDMIFFYILKLPSFYPKILSYICFKNDLELDSDFTNSLTQFEKNIISNIIKLISNLDFTIPKEEITFKNNTDLANRVLYFTKETSLLLYDEAETAIKNNRIYVDSSIKENAFCGTLFSANQKNYYYVSNIPSKNTFSSLNHELSHGLINTITNEKFHNNNLILYKEVLSILSEFYSNNYLLDKKEISYQEYVANFNDIYLTYLYNDIWLTSFLFTLSKNDFNKTHKNVKSFLLKELKNKKYTIELEELTEYPLSFYLTYLYSAAIAISFYYNYDKKDEAISSAINFLKEINETNEEEMFKKYNINIIDTLNMYVFQNNQLIKKMKSR